MFNFSYETYRIADHLYARLYAHARAPYHNSVASFHLPVPNTPQGYSLLVHKSTRSAELLSSPFPKVIFFATKGKKTDHKNTAMIRTRVASVSSSRPGPTTSAEAPASRYVSRPVLTFFCDRCGATGYHNIDLCQPHHCSIVPHTSPRHHRWYT